MEWSGENGTEGSRKEEPSEFQASYLSKSAVLASDPGSVSLL